MVTKLVQNISGDSRSTGSSRERVIFGAIESISKKFWKDIWALKNCVRKLLVSVQQLFEMCVTNLRTQILLWGKMLPSWHKSQPSLRNSQKSTVHSKFSRFNFNVFPARLLFWKVLIQVILFVLPVSMSWDHICQMKHANDKRGITAQWTFCHFEYLDKIPRQPN